MKGVQITHLTTEQRNPRTMQLDSLPLREFLAIMNDEDAKVAFCVKDKLEEIAQAVEYVVAALKQGGRLFYIGSGTSGRLGVLDAVECPPTFSTTNEVTGLIAGGNEAFVQAKEGAEDNEELGATDIVNAGVTGKDVVIGLAASGRTPHTIGALKKANAIGAVTVSVSCNPDSEIGKVAKLAIDLNTGPEVLTGSTRLKAGTAQKMVLNMISTASMIGIGKTYQNLMVDVKPSNAKLVERGKRIIMEATDCDYATAEKAFEESGRNPKTAIVMILLQCDYATAKERLEKGNHFIKNAIK